MFSGVSCCEISLRDFDRSQTQVTTNLTPSLKSQLKRLKCKHTLGFDLVKSPDNVRVKTSAALAQTTGARPTSQSVAVWPITRCGFPTLTGLWGHVQNNSYDVNTADSKEVINNLNLRTVIDVQAVNTHDVLHTGSGSQRW